jgi:hypothetical protein
LSWNKTKKQTKYPKQKKQKIEREEEEEEIALVSALVQKFLMAIIINKAKRNVNPFMPFQFVLWCEITNKVAVEHSQTLGHDIQIWPLI